MTSIWEATPPHTQQQQQRDSLPRSTSNNNTNNNFAPISPEDHADPFDHAPALLEENFSSPIPQQQQSSSSIPQQQQQYHHYQQQQQEQQQQQHENENPSPSANMIMNELTQDGSLLIAKTLQHYNSLMESQTLEQLWYFIETYFTFLEAENEKFHVIIAEYISQEDHTKYYRDPIGLLVYLTNNSQDVSLIFDYLTNLGHQIAQKPSKTDSDLFYLTNIMLWFDYGKPVQTTTDGSSENKNISILYNFTQYLNYLKSKEPQEYSRLNEKFVESLVNAKTKTKGGGGLFQNQNLKKNNDEGFFASTTKMLESYVNIPLVNKECQVKYILLGVLIVLFLICIVFLYFFNGNNNNNSFNFSSMFSSSNGDSSSSDHNHNPTAYHYNGPSNVTSKSGIHNATGYSSSEGSVVSE